jgi:hypothetical protein
MDQDRFPCLSCRRLPRGFTFLALFSAITTYQAAGSTIPIENDFAFAQQLYVDSGWDAIATAIADFNPGLNTEAILHYEGTFDVTVQPDGSFAGTYDGTLSGMFLDEFWQTSYSASMTSLLNDPDETRTFAVTSKGKWGSSGKIPADIRGKDFEDSGSMNLKKDKADIDVTIKTNGAEDKKAKATDLSRTDKQISGSVEVEKRNETFTITLDPDKKTFTSKLTSFVTVLENSGSYTAAAAPNGGETGTVSFDLDVSITSVPEVTTGVLTWSGLLLALFVRQTRKPRCSM